MALGRNTIEMASRQGWHISRSQLTELGLSPSAVDRLVSNGDLEQVTPGVYRLLDSGDHSDLIRGAVLKLPNAVASHQSAAHLLDFPIRPTLVPTVTVHSRTTHQFPGVVVRRAHDVDRSDITKVDGVSVTTVGRTAFDLAGILDFDTFDRITEALLVADRLKMSHLERVAKRLSRRGKRGSASVAEFFRRRLPGHVIPPTVLEEKGRSVLKDRGLPSPTPEYPIPWDPRRRFDDAYPDARIAIEWDSIRWHSKVEAMAADRERDREAALHGWVLVRFTWSDVTERPDHVADTIAGLLAARSNQA